jgi:hypothetical protein
MGCRDGARSCPWLVSDLFAQACKESLVGLLPVLMNGSNKKIDWPNTALFKPHSSHNTPYAFRIACCCIAEEMTTA